jgi:hypothetical protein
MTDQEQRIVHAAQRLARRLHNDGIERLPIELVAMFVDGQRAAKTPSQLLAALTGTMQEPLLYQRVLERFANNV